MSEEGAACFIIRKWFTRKKIKSKPYCPSTAYKNKYTLAFSNNGKEVWLRKNFNSFMRLVYEVLNSLNCWQSKFVIEVEQKE